MLKVALVLFLAASLGFAVGWMLPNDSVAHCDAALVRARSLGLVGASHNRYMGTQGCVLRVETGQWLPE